MALIGIALTFTACDKGNDPVPDVVPDPVIEYPSLRIVNESTENSLITSVSLVGYDFGSLNIAVGSSQTFALDKGMPGGYEDINLNVRFRAANTSYGTESLAINFSKGETRTIRLKGCHGAHVCTGFYLD